ncbi:MAG: TIGR03960 family B12-binding radical SAM protein [Planctomycetota bacterium]|nr:TIGR03960 family B12-binding radical SAM protein [Planctomycetota bacterium]
MADANRGGFSAAHPLLVRVKGPGQYVGGEPNQIVKQNARLRLALAFPDAYAVGMSHHGLRVLYEAANAVDGVAAERVFAPFPDFERELREAGIPLATLETATPLRDCQMIGFSISYELAATGMLTILSLGGVPLTRFERENGGAPIVIAGGASAMNPEPYSDFVDLFVMGEADEALPEMLERAKAFPPLTPESRKALLEALAREVEGVYVPALYETAEDEDGVLVVQPRPGSDAPLPIRRRLVQDFAALPSAVRPVVPIHETVHERAVLEIMRGCPNGCRFCQAGYAARPQRERDPAALLEAAKRCIAASGYDEIGLLSLSTSNYSRFDELIGTLDREFAPRGVSLSLPSLRVDHALAGIPSRVSSVRKSGLTIAPEAGSDRLRAVINKDVKNGDLLAAAEEAFRLNWRRIKLYFMLGLPTETDDDVLAIAELAHLAAKKRPRSAKGRQAIHISASNFVPKPHTAFQWCGAAGVEAWTAKQRLLSGAVNRRLVAYNAHDVEASLLEAAFSRGDRRLGKVILAAWKKGARLDAWSEYFRPELWREAFLENGLDAGRLAQRDIPPDAPTPWSHIDSGVRTDFLRREYGAALRAARTPACGPGSCAGCGVPGCAFAGGGR